uniref:Uncharacterized protein n=1 Tax=Vespula pensylvanica TaxID=30213 RepID=A0A834U463_VESPE|nr:hypothetical protein H0235_012482 [Vespula pensylvanica]
MVTAERADQESTRSNIGKSNSNNSNGDRQYRHWQSQYEQRQLQMQRQQPGAQLNRVSDYYYTITSTTATAVAATTTSCNTTTSSSYPLLIFYLFAFYRSYVETSLLFREINQFKETKSISQPTDWEFESLGKNSGQAWPGH